MIRGRKNSGSILVVSTWMLAILSVLALGMAFRSSMEARLSKYNMDRVQALYLAKAGVVQCQALLANDTNAYDSIYESGITAAGDKSMKDLFLDVKPGKDPQGSFSVSYDQPGFKNFPGMMDEERKININTVPEEDIMRLIQVVIETNRLAIGSESAQEIASSIVAWRTIGTSAEDAYYASLVVPYSCKHGRFSAIEELLLVKGMDIGLFNVLNDFITVSGPEDGANNINTASKEVLIARGMTEALSAKVIRFRNGVDGVSGTKDDQPFVDVNTIEVILKAGLPEGLTEEETALIGELGGRRCFITRSNYFRIESNGVIDKSGITKMIVCVVQRDAGVVKEGAKPLVSYREF